MKDNFQFSIFNFQLFYRFLLWRDKHIKEKHFILIVSFLVGICTAAAAIVLKSIIHFIQHLLTGNFNQDGANYLYLLYPVIGILLAGLFVKYIVRDDISHGVTKILYAISQRKSRIKPHNAWTSIVASSVTIGFGGSVGAEAPIVLTGAPIAGVVFVVEVLLLDLTMTSVLPLLITSVTAATVSYIFTGTEAMFPFSQTEAFVIERIPYVLLLGVFCGLVSLYFTKVMNRVEGMYRNLNNYWKKFVVGGIMLSVLIFIFPPLYGEGYDTISSLLNGQFSHIMDKSMFYSLNDTYWGLQIFLTLILLFKVFASSATNAGGGCGGIFAPSLYLGCIAGFVFAHASNYFPFTMYLSEKNFALLGMAGIMSGVMHAPLTGVFLIAELTGGYALFLPLMIVSVSSYITIKMFLPHSIYSMRLAQKGELLTHHKDRAVLTLLNTDSVIERDFLTVSPEMSLGDMVKVIAKSGRNMFPVIDERGILLGLVLLDNIRNIMFRPELYNRFHVSKFMVSAPAKIQVGTPMEQIMRIFDDTKAWNLPVVDEEGRYIGFMSKSKIFNSYREVLVENFSGD